jgi:cation diffusion facilitator CzcD-associated flavoprotein CzcO
MVGDIEHVDVLIVGAGISGVGAAYHLTTQLPERSFVVLEALESFGGTWLTHKYPGIRSDSDLYTFGYRFKPWTGPPIATAEEILAYMGEVIDDNDLARHIRYHHRIERADWSSDTNTWTLQVRDTSTGAVHTFTCNFLWMCQGYYRHAEGYTPEWPGMDRFEGRIVHPQTWPDDLDLDGRQVVVIGSGATAATVVPAIAGQCAHVTVLQRSPTYFWTGRNANELADTLRELEIDETWIHEIVRRKVLHDQEAVTRLSFEEPEFLRDILIENAKAHLPEGYDMRHFTPEYRPWQQRLAFVPDGDLFEGIKAGKASMVTDEIDTFFEKGIRTKGGEELIADVIITATGFELSVLGDIAFTIDGAPMDLADTVTYRGMMFTGVPNLLWVFGYFRASWTLRADLISAFVLRLLRHMDELGARRVVPQLRPQDEALPKLSWIDPNNFNPNYLMRSVDLLPRRLDVPEWQHTQDYWTEKDALPAADLDDGCLVYE